MGCLLLCAKERENVLYQLVIAEKPSVAQSLASVLGAKQRRDGYLEGNGWLVSWYSEIARAGLADADAYAPEYAKWRIDDLPILPESWRFTIAKDKREQFDVLRTLLRREDVTEIVNGCDAGREGELIFRTVYCLAGCSKPIKRLWISSMEDSAIRAGFANLKDGREYDCAPSGSPLPRQSRLAGRDQRHPPVFYPLSPYPEHWARYVPYAGVARPAGCGDRRISAGGIFHCRAGLRRPDAYLRAFQRQGGR